MVDERATMGDCCLDFATAMGDDERSEDQQQGPYSELDLELGLRHLLRVQRNRRGWIQKEAGDYFGILQSSYARWETGDNRPGDDQIPRVAEFLGLPEKDIARMKYKVDLTAEHETPAERAAHLSSMENRLERLESRVDTLADLIDETLRAVRGRNNPTGWQEFTSDVGRRPPRSGSEN